MIDALENQKRPAPSFVVGIIFKHYLRLDRQFVTTTDQEKAMWICL